MDAQNHLADLRLAFRALNHDRILELREEAVAHDLPQDDYTRIVYAFALMAKGDLAAADVLLQGVVGDATASLADFAYVRAFRREYDADHEAVLSLLVQHLDAPDATHAARMRLRAADALLKLKRPAETPEILTPLLQPPGVPETLEAHLILLQAMLDAKADKEKLIEVTATIDVLMERGFRLSEAGNVVYYARLLDGARIEPPIKPLLTGHDDLLDQYETADPAEIEFLALAGEKHKAPAAVRAAGRSYRQNPFPWKTGDPQQLVYLFSTHEEHEAARAVITTTYPKSRIAKEQELWGPLILATYHSGLWRDTLDMLRNHRAEIARSPFATHSRIVQAVCEYQLHRDDEALAHIRELGPEFFRAADGTEAAAEILLLARLGRIGDIGPAFVSALTAGNTDTDFPGVYTSTVLNELLIREHDDALLEWFRVLGANIHEPDRSRLLQQFALVAIEWSKPQAGFLAADQIESASVAAAHLLRALSATARGDADQTALHFNNAFAAPPSVPREQILMFRARSLRRLGRLTDALAVLDELLTPSDAPPNPVALAMKAGILRTQGQPRDAWEPLVRSAGEAALRVARSREEYTVLTFEISQIQEGEDAESLLALARRTERRAPGTVEALRLARRVATAPHATPEIRTAAEQFVANWKAENLK